jgi:hypothetical protein
MENGVVFSDEQGFAMNWVEVNSQAMICPSAMLINLL